MQPNPDPKIYDRVYLTEKPVINFDCRVQMVSHSNSVKAVSVELKQELVTILPKLRRFAWSLTRSQSDADDLVQDACLKAISRSEQRDQTQPLDRWMFTMTRNLWISEVRKRKVRLGQGQVDAVEAKELVSNNTGEAQTAAAQIQAKIRNLPEELSSPLLLISVEGYSYAEAADLLDIPIGTVMSRLHRARKTIASALNEQTKGAKHD